MTESNNNSLTVTITDADPAYRVGDVVRVVAEWSLDRVPKSVEARLLWSTSGRGTVDTGVVATLACPTAGITGRWAFDFTVPPGGPASYHGKLVSVQWSIEVLADGQRAWDRADLVVSPTRRALRAPDQPPALPRTSR